MCVIVLRITLEKENNAMLKNKLKLAIAIIQLLMICNFAFADEKEELMPNSVYDFTVTTIAGEEQNLADYKGKILLIVNSASKCGFTPQFEGLEELYQKFSGKGFEILGFPCNQFGGQDPGSEKEILEFCQVNYGVTFPMFSKIEVNGENTHPLYRYLKTAAPGILGSENIKWNFTKFLIDTNGKVLQRFASSTTPKDIEKHIIKLIEKK